MRILTYGWHSTLPARTREDIAPLQCFRRNYFIRTKTEIFFHSKKNFCLFLLLLKGKF